MPFTRFLQKFQFGAGRGWISVKNGSGSVAMDGWVAERPEPCRGGEVALAGGVSPTAGVLGLEGLGLQVEPGRSPTRLPFQCVPWGWKQFGMEKTCGS